MRRPWAGVKGLYGHVLALATHWGKEDYLKMSLLKKLKTYFFEKPISKILFPRAPRVRVRPFHDLKFKLLSEKSTQLDVHNISTSGIGFKKNQDQSWQSLGMRLTGVLELGGRAFRATAEVRHISTSTVGAKFVATEENFSKELEGFLLLEVTGLGLREIRTDVLKAEEGTSNRWFTDSHGNELYLTLQSEQIKHVHMTFLGNYAEWSMDKGARVGYVVEDDRSGPKQKSSNMVRYIEDPPPEAGRLIMRFILGMDALGPALQERVLNCFSSFIGAKD